MTPVTIRRILVPVDFGPASARAVAAAGRLARAMAAELHLLHAEAVDAPAYFTHDQVETLARQRQQMQAQAQAFLGKFGRQHTSTPFDARVDQRPPIDAVLHAAADADLIVMGTHGRRGASRWWLGSVTERVLHHLDRPLLVLHEADDPDVVFARVDVFGEAAEHGPARALADAIAAPFGADVVAHGAAPARPPAPGRGGLAVIAMPASPDRRWFAAAEPLVRSGAGALLFVPDAAVEDVRSLQSSRRIS